MFTLSNKFGLKLITPKILPAAAPMVPFLSPTTADGETMSRLAKHHLRAGRQASGVIIRFDAANEWAIRTPVFRRYV